MSHRVFLLSPANLGGRRAAQALSPRATFALAAALRSAEGAPLGDLFTFVSGLYFRGKLTYARRFARPPEPGNSIAGEELDYVPIVGATLHGARPPKLAPLRTYKAEGQGGSKAGIQG